MQARSQFCSDGVKGDKFTEQFMTAISFSNALGVHEQAIGLRVKRAEIIANNLANADTPGFKARDVDFAKALGNVSGSQGSSLRLSTTHASHLRSNGSENSGGVPIAYRQPLQSSLDGNTVDSQFESSEFAKNAVEFAASFRLLNGKFSGLSKAIKGE